MFLVVEILLITVGYQNMFFLKPGGCSACYTTNKRTETLQQKKKDILTPKSDRVQTPGPSSEDFINKASCRRSKSDHGTSHTACLTESEQCRCLLSAVNFNQLGYFIIANFLTGIVNLSMETIHAPPLTAFIILNIYLLVLNIIIMVLYRYKILLKV